MPLEPLDMRAKNTFRLAIKIRAHSNQARGIYLIETSRLF